MHVHYNIDNCRHTESIWWKKISRQILQLNHVYTLCTIYLRAKPLFYFVFLLPSVCTKLKCKKWSFELYSTEQNVSD